MSESAVRILIGSLVAVLIPAGILHAAAGEERHALGLTAAPFALPRVFVSHLVAALPLGFVVAAWLRAKQGRDFSPTIWGLVGFAAAGIVTIAGPVIGEAVVGADVGPAPALLLRSLLAFVLVLPWCVALGTSVVPLRRWEATIGMLIAVVPTGAYAEAVLATRTKSAEELMLRARFARASGVVLSLRELGSDTPIRNKSPADIQREIDTALDTLKKAVARPLPANASPNARLTRAFALVALFRLNDAVELLTPLAVIDANAMILLGHAYQEMGRHAESINAFEAGIERLLPKAATNAADRSVCVEAFNAMALHPQEMRQFGEVERIFRRGLEAMPSEAAHFHYQLGKMYADAGRPALALEHLHASAKLDPARFQAPADDVIRQIRTHTYGCFLPGSSSVGQPASR